MPKSGLIVGGGKMIENAGYFYIVNAIVMGLGFILTDNDWWIGIVWKIVFACLCLMNIMAAAVSFGYVVQQ